jgi:hypothetical protein
MATFFVSKIKPLAPHSVNVAFSGGGIYIFLHHGVFDEYIERFSEYPNYSMYIDTLTCALNMYINDLAAAFYVEYPQYKPYVKADSLNNAKRVFKTLFSVHKKHFFAVIPLDPDNIKIDFDAAALPLSKSVLDSAKDWYNWYDAYNRFILSLNQYLEEAHDYLSRRVYGSLSSEPVNISELDPDFDSYPPCIKNILNMERCNVGSTRALAFLAVFFKHFSKSEQEVSDIFFGKARQWNVPTSNILESWYGDKSMHCPNCRTLYTPGPGYPHIDIASIGACTPDMTCYKVGCSNPVYYVDRKQYAEKLKRRLFEKNK